MESSAAGAGSTASPRLVDRRIARKIFSALDKGECEL
jgi:hypothetical protein